MTDNNAGNRGKTVIQVQDEAELVSAIFRLAFIFLVILTPVNPDGMVWFNNVKIVSLGIAAIYNILVVIQQFTTLKLRWQQHFVMLLDYVLASLWIYLTLTVENNSFSSPLFAIYYLLIINSAMTFGIVGAIIGVALASTGYIVAFVSIAGIQPFDLISLLFNKIIYLFLTAILCGYLVDSHRRERDKHALSQVILAKLKNKSQVTEEMYQLLTPADLPKIRNLDIASRWVPSRGIGGDFYDVIQVSDSKVFAVIADISGKEALKFPLFKAAFLSAAHFENDPVVIMEKTSKILYDFLQPDMFIAAVVISIDLDEGIMKVVNAGLDLPVLVRKNGDMERLKNGGIIIGVDKLSKYTCDEIVLNQGDTICVFTDGITEARNHEKQEFGDHTIASIVVSGVRIDLSANEIVENIFQRVLAHTHKAPRRDDMTMMMIKYIPEPK